MQAYQHVHDHNSDHFMRDNLFCFLGGVLINLLWVKLQSPLTVSAAYEYIQSLDFFLHCIKSFSGGVIALLLKLLYDTAVKPLAMRGIAAFGKYLKNRFGKGGANE